MRERYQQASYSAEFFHKITNFRQKTNSNTHTIIIREYREYFGNFWENDKNSEYQNLLSKMHSHAATEVMRKCTEEVVFLGSTA